MSLALITKPAVEPITLADAKAHLRVEHSDDDALISELIAAARQYLEKVTGLVFITQTWRQFEDCWPSSRYLNTGRHPVQSIQSITVYDAQGIPQLIDADNYLLDNVSRPARLLSHTSLVAGQAMNGIEIEFVAGYGDTGIDVPDALKRALHMLSAHWYEFRGAIAPSQQPVSIPPGFAALISPWKRRAI